MKKNIIAAIIVTLTIFNIIASNAQADEKADISILYKANAMLEAGGLFAHLCRTELQISGPGENCEKAQKAAPAISEALNKLAENSEAMIKIASAYDFAEYNRLLQKFNKEVAMLNAATTLYKATQ